MLLNEMENLKKLFEPTLKDPIRNIRQMKKSKGETAADKMLEIFRLLEHL